MNRACGSRCQFPIPSRYSPLGAKEITPCRDTGTCSVFSHTRLTPTQPQALVRSRPRQPGTGGLTETLQEVGVKIRRVAMSPGTVQLRYPLGSRTGWKVEKFGSAIHLEDFPR